MDKETRQIEIQRLIDGRMPQSERVALLECLDDGPDGWRELALGFVEEQVLRSELSTLATRNDVDKSLPRVTLHRARTGLWFSATAVVVALLVGGVAGRWLSSQEDSSDMDSGEVAEEPSSTGAQSQADDDYYVLLKPAIASPGEESSWDHVAASLWQPRAGARHFMPASMPWPSLENINR
jgi:hypothetical protein